jgi:Carboxypeptidase regulatory-like domain
MQFSLSSGTSGARAVWSLGWLGRYAALTLAVLTLLLSGQRALAQATASIQGKATDSSGTSVFGAVVTVKGPNGTTRTTVTDVEGAFQILSLPPGNYDVKISASGFSDWTASNVPASLTPESQPLAAVIQVAPSVTTVTVGLAPEELAAEQVKQETQQRVMGVIPNYFVAYEGHAAPLSPKQKLNLSYKMLIDPATFAAVGITAGIQQGRNSYRQFGQGSEGYGKRFGAAYGSAATNLLITSVLADSVLHQDPRYFYSGEGTKKQRAWYAIESAFRAKGDNGKWQPPYAGLLGAVAAAELSDLYYPGSRTQYTLLGRSLMFHFVGLIGLNLGEELFLKKFTSHAPATPATSVLVLREGSPVELIAVDGIGPHGPTAGQTVTFVLAEDLTQNGKVLARTGDVASGQVTQVTPGTTPEAAGSVALQNVTLHAGAAIDIPLRGNQVRGAATPVQYRELPGSGKVEVTLFVAENVRFPESD